jgi:molybdenum cofactor cytidylyltransferase
MHFHVGPSIPAEASEISLIVLGAGLSHRYGADDKLGADLAGRPLAHHALEALLPFAWAERILICSDQQDWQDRYVENHFSLIRNLHPKDGMASSLRLGALSVRAASKVLVCLADMPLIDQSHIERIVSLSASGEHEIIATKSANHAGPPALIPLAHLLSLPRQGDMGARDILQYATFVETDLLTTHDVDSPADMILAAELSAIR